MSATHLHLLLNHIPIIGTFFAVALLAIGLVRRSPEVTRLGLLTFVIVALVAVPTYLTGEPAEEIVEHLPGVSHDIIEEHEEAALPASIVLWVTGAGALLSLVMGMRGRRGPRWLNGAVLALGVVAFVAMARLGNIGGQIRHTEVRPDFVAEAARGEGEEGEDHE